MQRIENLRNFLRNYKGDQFIIRTTCVAGGWYDNEFDAHAAGFDIYRFINPEYEANHTFSECYKFVRRK